MVARRRGAIVTLLDEGGMDTLAEPARERVLNQLAEALRGSAADKIIVRTANEGSDTAVTVVGLRSTSDADGADALDDEDDEVDLWLEIPKS